MTDPKPYDELVHCLESAFDAGEAVRNHIRRKAEKRRRKMGLLAWGFLSLCVGVALIWGLW